MRLRLIAAGTRMPAWVQQGYRDYAGRMPPECALELREIALPKRTRGADIGRLREREGEGLLAAAAGGQVIALDAGGRQWTTEELARQMEDWRLQGGITSFLVGGPDGLSKACLAAASRIWSLSRLTLPHPLVRVMVAEQLYRAWTVLQGHPYHRG